MTQLPTREQVKIGIKVFVELKQDQGTGKLTEGIVKEVLTPGDTHPYGIMVDLQSGQRGRVKELFDSKINSTKLSEFEDLDKKQVPQSEDKFNEFKEFYQYDDGMDHLPDSLPQDKKLKIIEEKKQPVRERFATAVLSFGNDPIGGFVYLGVKADGTISGLENDKRIENFSDYNDEFANHIRDSLETFLKDRVFIISKLQIKFTKINDKTICIIQVLPAFQPLFLHTSSGKEFFVRGPAPRAEHLEGKDMFSFIKDRFPNYN